MRKQAIVLSALLTLALSIPALAAGRGGGAGGGFGGGVGVGGGFSGGGGGASGVNGNFGGQSSAHIGTQGQANTNGPNASDRDFGTDRAQDRESNQGLNSQAEANAASELGKLNAGHASATARDNASANSTVGSIAAYDKEMSAALALTNPTARNAAIVAARQKLAQNSNKTLTASAAARIDGMLGISGAPSNLGTTP